jgi:glycosyltransferase involved in cell wall biosynthesis
MTRDCDPLVSVIIGVYNGEPYLCEAIDSVLAQTYSCVELIVVDDGSDDGTPANAKSYGGRLRYIRQERQGMGAARNTGVTAARGTYLAFLDADDRFTADKLDRQLAAFRADPSLDVVFGHMTEFVSPDIEDDARELLRAPVHDVAWRTPNLMLVRAEAFHRVGPFSTTLRVGIGVDWFARATEQELKTATVPVTVLERRLHAQNNGLRHRDARPQYLHVLKAALDRRREQERNLQ